MSNILRTTYIGCRSEVETVVLISRPKFSVNEYYSFTTTVNGILFAMPCVKKFRNKVFKVQSPRVHLPLSYFSFHVITFHLVHGLSASLPLKFGTPYLFTSGNHNHSLLSDVI